MLAEILFLPNHPILLIVLVHWYDYYSKWHPIKYECPHMKFVNKYISNVLRFRIHVESLFSVISKDTHRSFPTSADL